MSWWTMWRILFLVELSVTTVAATGTSMSNVLWQPVLQYAKHKYPEFLFETNELINYLGYPCELHKVTTEDGYILKVFRIPYGKSGRGAYSKRPPVFVQHGLLSSSDDFVISNANQSLGFMLADAGYDVWLGNARGNKYGLGHTKPIPSEKDFFSFSFDQMGEFDLPAVIDHILKVTNYKDLQFIGHSLGVTTGLVMLSTKIQYNAKVRHFHAMAPIAWLNHVRTPVVLLAPFVKELKFLLDLIQYYYFLPNYDIIKFLGLGCSSVLKEVCEGILGLLSGPDSQQLNSTRMPVIVSHAPSGSSTNTVVQCAQVVNSERFQKYDYGIFANLRKYGQLKPPEYDVGKVSTNVSLYWGPNDYMADPRDVAHLRANLRNCVDDYRVHDPKFGHFDFVWAIDNARLINDYLISKLVKY